MKKIFVLVASLFLCTLFVNAQNNVIDNELQKILNQKGNDYIDVNIMFKSQMTTDDFAVLNCKSDSKEVRRELIINELKKFAEKSQRDVMSVINAEERSNSVIDIKTHWIANFINCKAKRDVIYQLASHPDVALITHNSEMDTEFMLSNEETRGTQAATGNIAQHVTQIKADKVWDLGYTGKGVVVAVLDSGTNLDHADIKDHLWNGNGKYGYNVHSINSIPSDEGSNGHGTHSAGIVCGDGTSGQKTGIAPDATLMTIKIIGGGRCSAQNLVEGVEKAAELGADIISLSVGRENPDENRALFRQTFTNLLEANIAAAVACGNDGITSIPVPHNVRTPGDCPPPWIHPDQQGNANNNLTSVISVGAVNENNEVSPSSSKGPVTWQNIDGYNDYPYNPGIGLIRPDIAAPGENVYSLNVSNNNGYWGKSGTSQAAPCVAGVMALMLEKNPNLTPADLCRIIETTASNKPATKNNSIGSGVIDALAAVQAVNFNEAIVINPYDYTRTLNTGSNLNLELTLINNGSGSTNGNTTVTISENDNYTTIVTGSKSYSTMASGKTASATFVVSVDALAPDNHEVTFTVNAGTRTFDIVVTISNEFVAPVVNATANGTNVNLTWNATNNATSYNVYRDGALLTNTTSTSYTDSGLEYGTIYAYTVTSKRGDLESEHSLITRAQTEDNPDRPSPTNVVANNGTVTWTNGAESNGSNIYRKDYLAGTETSIATNVNGTSYTDNTWNSLEDGVYQYGVANTYAVNEIVYTQNFTDLYLTNSTGTYPTMNAYWYIYREGSNNSYNWKIDSYITNYDKTYESFSGNAAFITSNFTSSSYLSYLVTRPMTYNEAVKLSFKYITPAWGNDINTLKVMVSRDTHTGTWEELWSSNKTDVQEWTEAVVDLSAYVGQQIYIAFVNVAGYGYCTGVDEVSIAAESNSESRIEWSELVGKNVNMFVQDGNWSNTDNWTAKRLPNENDAKVIIDANATITTSGNINVNSLVINEGKTLTINDGVILNVSGDFANTDVDAFIINDGAQVFQNNEDVSATFRMNIVNPEEWGTNKTGWQFIASPLKYSKISDFVPSSYSDYDLYKYDGTKTYEWLNHKDENNYEPVLPETPQNLEAVANSTSTMSLTWGTVEGALGYKLYYNDDEFIETNNNTYSFTGLTAGTEYCYTVSAINEDGESEKSAEVCAKTITLAPQNLVATATGSSSIELTWDAVTGAERYVIYKDSEKIASYVNKTTYEVSNLNPATEYCFTVTAANYYDGVLGIESAESTPACATTDITIPTAPQNIIADVTPYSATLRWDPVLSAASYRIYLMDEKVGETTSTEYTIEGLSPQGNYYYTVTAVNAKGESAKNGVQFTTPLPTPEAPQLAATVVGSAVELTWNAPAYATTYKVYEDEDLVAEGLSSTTYTVYDLEAGEHCFTVVAVGAGGESAPSTSACATVTEQEQGPIVENVIIGSGNGSTTVLPSTFSSAYSISQQIYTRAEIGQTGEIKSVSFKYKSGSATTRTVKVYMKHSVQGVFTDSNSWESMTDADDLVYEGDITISGTPDEWIRIKLSEPFEYTGGNLVVCVYDYTNRADNSTSFYADELSETKSLYYYPFLNATPLNPANMNGKGYTSKNRNQIRFSFVTGNEPAIPAVPSNLIATCSQEMPTDDVYTNAITLTWNADATAEIYHIYDAEGTTIGQTSETTFTIEGLECATRYCYYVSAENEAGEGAQAEVCATTITARPQELVAVSTDLTTISLSWYPVAGATSYNIHFGEGNIIGSTSELSYEVTGLETGSTYCYSVTAVSEGGESQNSERACAEAGDIEIVMCNLTFNLYDDWGDGWNGNKLVVTYGTTTENITMTDGSTDTRTLEIPKNTDVTVTFTKGTSYPAPEETSFTITCENGWVLASAATGSLSGGEVFTFVADCTPKAPNAPELTAEATGVKTIALSWNEVANATSYNVYQGAARIATGLTATSYNVEGLNPSTDYCFSVTAVNEYGESEASEDCVRTMDLPTAPQNLVATVDGSSSISLTWEGNSNAISYNIYQDSEFIINVTEETYVVKNLNSETEYCFTITSVNGDFESAATAAACATTEKGKVLIDVVVETGTDKNPTVNNNYYLPVYDYSAYAMSQQIYTAEELSVSGGKINSVAFKLGNSTSSTTRQYEVYITNTTLNTFNGYNFVSVSENDKVFDGSVYISGTINTWFTINFDKSFDYTGDNIIITVYDKTGYGLTNYGAYHMFYRYTTSGRSLYKQGSSAYDMSNLSTGTSQGYTAQIQLGMSVDPTPTAPQNLVAEAESSSSISLSWNPVWVATSYNVYKGSEFVANVTGTTCTVQGLAASTTYCYKVTSVNELGEESEATAEVCATTKVEIPQLYIIETGTDKNPNANSNYYVPVYDYSSYAMSQQIYTEEEMSGAVGGIYSIAFKLGMQRSTVTRKYEVYLTSTALNAFNGNNYIALSEADKVFDGSVEIGGAANSWYTIVFDKPFEYTGGNIVLTVYDKTGTGNTANYHSFYKYSATGRALYSYGSSYNMLNLTTGTTYSNVSQVQFGVAVDPTPTAPQNLVATAKNSSSISLSWDPVLVATSYNVYEGSELVANVDETTYTVQDLDPETTYCFTVKTVNELGESATAAEACASTKAASTTPPTGPTTFFFDFQDNNLEAFNLIDANKDGKNWGTTIGYNSDNYYAISYSYQGGAITPDNYMVTKEAYAITAVSKLSYEVWGVNGSPDYYAVVVSEDGETFESVLEEALPSNASTHRTMEVDLSAYSGKGLYIGFRHYNCTNQYYVCIDNFQLTGESAPALPTTFFFDFQDNNLEAFNLIDANKDGKNWGTTIGYNSDNYYAISYSYQGGAITPDNYMVTKEAYTITAASKLSYEVWGVNGNPDYYAVVVSEDGETFESVLEETLPSNASTHRTMEVDLSAYSGKGLYIGFHHYNCTNQYYVCIDNFQLTDGSAKSSAPTAKMTDVKGGFEKVSAFGTSSGTELSKFETEFEQGVGYLASYENETVATFKGILHHEKSYEFNLGYNSEDELSNYYLLGNPFSFNMNWANTTANDLANGYAVVNEQGGYNYLTSGEIKVGDGFFVKAIGSNPTLSYNQRSSRNIEEVSSLNVIASGKAGNDNVIVNLAGEQEGFPKIKNFNEDIALVYVLENGAPYGIYNCNSDALEVELVFKAKRMGEYNIHIEPTGEFKHVVLVDKINGVETDMLTRSYSFTTTPQENGNRFVLKFAKGNSTVEQDKFAFMSGEELIFNTDGVVQIIDVMGRVVYSSEVTSDNNRINVSNFSQAAYVVRLINGDGAKTQKIVVY